MEKKRVRKNRVRKKKEYVQKEYAKREYAKKDYAKKYYAKKHPPSPTAAVQLLVNHILEDYCLYVQSFPSILAPEILPASDNEPRLAYTDPSGERQQAPSTSRWGPSSL